VRDQANRPGSKKSSIKKLALQYLIKIFKGAASLLLDGVERVE
jgi:hypothetical protein